MKIHRPKYQQIDDSLQKVRFPDMMHCVLRGGSPVAVKAPKEVPIVIDGFLQSEDIRILTNILAHPGTESECAEVMKNRLEAMEQQHLARAVTIRCHINLMTEVMAEPIKPPVLGTAESKIAKLPYLNNLAYLKQGKKDDKKEYPESLRAVANYLVPHNKDAVKAFNLKSMHTIDRIWSALARIPAEENTTALKLENPVDARQPLLLASPPLGGAGVNVHPPPGDMPIPRKKRPFSESSTSPEEPLLDLAFQKRPYNKADAKADGYEVIDDVHACVVEKARVVEKKGGPAHVQMSAKGSLPVHVDTESKQKQTEEEKEAEMVPITRKKRPYSELSTSPEEPFMDLAIQNRPYNKADAKADGYEVIDNVHACVLEKARVVEKKGAPAHEQMSAKGSLPVHVDTESKQKQTEEEKEAEMEAMGKEDEDDDEEDDDEIENQVARHGGGMDEEDEEEDEEDDDDEAKKEEVPEDGEEEVQAKGEGDEDEKGGGEEEDKKIEPESSESDSDQKEDTYENEVANKQKDEERAITKKKARQKNVVAADASVAIPSESTADPSYQSSPARRTRSSSVSIPSESPAGQSSPSKMTKKERKELEKKRMKAQLAPVIELNHKGDNQDRKRRRSGRSQSGAPSQSPEVKRNLPKKGNSW
jgi:hypothetical protein